MKWSIVIIGIGFGIGFAGCTADLRDNNVCVMYARALCSKAASCGLLGNQSADQCLGPYLDEKCDSYENSSSAPDPRACGAAIDDAPCPGETPVSLPDCNRTLSRNDLINMGTPSGTGGNGGSGGSGGSGGTGGGSGGSGASGGSGGTGAKGGSGGVGGTTGGSGGTTGGAGGSSGGSSGAGGTPTTGTCTSYAPDTTYPCAMTVPQGCGTNPVSCGNMTSCAANSTCVTNGCQCNSGYISVQCATGMKCSGGCAASTWGCTPKPDPGCNGNPSQTAGTCKCSNGKTFNLACGSTFSCDERCRQGF